MLRFLTEEELFGSYNPHRKSLYHNKLDFGRYYRYMSFLAPLHPEQLTKDNEEDLLKKALYQQGKCLLIYPEVTHPAPRGAIPHYSQPWPRQSVPTTKPSTRNYRNV